MKALLLCSSLRRQSAPCSAKALRGGEARRRVVALLLVLGFAVSLTLPGADTVTFTPSPTSNVTYVLRWGPTAQVHTSSMQLGTNTIMALNDGPWGRFFFIVGAVSSNLVESVPSNEVLATNRPGAPLLLRLLPKTNNVVALETTFDGGLNWMLLTNFPINPGVTSQLFRATEGK